MKRSFANQARHNRKILDLAQRYLSLGYQVLADARGWEIPLPINGFRPDLFLIKGNRGLIIEIETFDSFPNAYPQLEAFRRFAEMTRNISFRSLLI